MAYFYCKVNDDFSIADNNEKHFFNDELHLRFMASLSEIYCVHIVSGTSSVDINGHIVGLKANDMLVLVGGCFIRILNQSDDFHFFCLIIGSESYRKLFDPIGFNLVTKEWIYKFYKTECSVAFHEIQIAFYASMRKRIVSDNVFDRSMVVHMFEMMILRDMELYWINNPKALLVPTRKEQVFYEFKKLVEIHFLKERNLLFYADALQLTPKYLSAVIKEVSGFQFTYWIDEPLITEAKRLLCCTDKTIKEISDALGFVEQSRFGRFFKNITGVSPSVFRDSEDK